MPFIFPGRGLHSHFAKFTGNFVSGIPLKISFINSNFALELAPMHLENSIITGIKIA